MSETREYFQRKYPEFIDDIERRFNFTIGNLPVPTNELEWLDLVKLVYSGASAAKDASIRDYMNICEDLSRKLEEARGRIAELECGREMWAVWNSCNGVFEVACWRRDALNIIAEAYSEHETVVPVRVFVEDEDRHWLCHQREDEREAMWKSRPDPETAAEAPTAPETPGAITGPKDG